MRVYGAEHVPRTGPAVIACNHIAGIDVVVLGAASPRTLRYMAKVELFTYNRVADLARAPRRRVRGAPRRVRPRGAAAGAPRAARRAPAGRLLRGHATAVGGDRPGAAGGGPDRSRRRSTHSAGSDPGHDLHQEVPPPPRDGHVRAAAGGRRRRPGAAARTATRSSRRRPSCSASSSACSAARRPRSRPGARATSQASTRR